MKNNHIFFLKSLVVLSWLGLCSCSSMHFDYNWGKPVHLNMEPPPGPPEYQLGWKQGCHSGWKGYAKQFHKVWGNFEQDPVLASQSKMYYRAWKNAYTYCAAYAMNTGNQSIGDNNGQGISGVFGTFGRWGDKGFEEWKNPFDMNDRFFRWDNTLW